jgi:hypothetical protein
MSIVFGLYNIKIKEYQPAELGITAESVKGCKIAVKQRIFHLFWIPFFPVMKIYALVDKDNQAYHASYELKKLIKKTGKHRTPWYSFALPIIGLVVLLIMLIKETVDNNHYRTLEENRMNAFCSYTSDLVQHIEKGDVLVMYKLFDWSSNEDNTYSDRLIFCVDSITPNEYYVKGKSISRKADDQPQSNLEFVQYFKDRDSLEPNKILLKDEVLNFATKRKSNPDDYGLEGGMDFNGDKYILHHKLSINRPNISLNESSFRSNSITLNVKYFGPIARIKDFKAIKGISGTPVYNKILSNQAYQSFNTAMTLNGVSQDDELEFQLTLETEEGKEYLYHVAKVGYNFYCVLQ